MPASDRKAFIITYSANGAFIEFSRIKMDEQLSSIDELHYTNDAAVVYTYVHFRKPVHPTKLMQLMTTLKAEMNITLFDVFGYDAIATNSRASNLTEHIAFKVLMEHYTTGNPSFKSCTDGQSGITRGLMYSHDHSARLKELADKRSIQMGDYVRKMEADLAEYKQKAEMVELMEAQVREYEARNEENRRYKFVCHVLRSRMEDIDESAQAFLLRPDHRKRPLFGDDRDRVGYRRDTSWVLRRALAPQ